MFFCSSVKYYWHTEFTECHRILFLTKEHKNIFFGTQKTRTYTEFNLLAKRAEDLRVQRYWGSCRDARFVHCCPKEILTF